MIYLHDAIIILGDDWWRHRQLCSVRAAIYQWSHEPVDITSIGRHNYDDDDQWFPNYSCPEWRQYVSPKLWRLPTSLHGAKTQNIILINVYKRIKSVGLNGSLVFFLLRNRPIDLFQFRITSEIMNNRHSVGLLGRVISSSQGFYLHRTTQHRQTRTHIHVISGIRTRDPVHEHSRPAPQTARPLDWQWISRLKRQIQSKTISSLVTSMNRLLAVDRSNCIHFIYHSIGYFEKGIIPFLAKMS
jgi:hypothetical protein